MRLNYNLLYLRRGFMSGFNIYENDELKLRREYPLVPQVMLLKQIIPTIQDSTVTAYYINNEKATLTGKELRVCRNSIHSDIIHSLLILPGSALLIRHSYEGNRVIKVFHELDYAIAYIWKHHALEPSEGYPVLTKKNLTGQDLINWVRSNSLEDWEVKFSIIGNEQINNKTVSEVSQLYRIDDEVNLSFGNIAIKLPKIV